MSSRPEDLPEDSLPTPVLTPAPFSYPESEFNSDSVSSSVSSHTLTAFHPAHVTSLLHNTPIKPSLSATNYVAW